MRSWIRCIVLVCIVFALTGAARADLLNISPEHYPLVFFNAVSVSYSINDSNAPAGMGLLKVSGWSMQFNTDPDTTVDLWAGDTTLEVLLDPANNFQPISGNLLVEGDPEGTLETLYASTRLQAFGYGENNKFELLFLQDGDMIASNNAHVGVILFAQGLWTEDGNSINIPDFSQSFSNNGIGYGDVFGMPEPSVMILLAAGAAGLLRRKNK